MRVGQVMNKKLYYATPNQTLGDAIKIIFGKDHTGLPVVEAKSLKLVGFITDQDILSGCFPSMKEYMEDVVHAGDFSLMEKKFKQVIKHKVKDVMSKNVVKILEDQPVLKAESIMKVKDISRLPVVDKNNKLVGIIRKKDIFKALVGKYL